jgi:hypothetical protein
MPAGRGAGGAGKATTTTQSVGQARLSKLTNRTDVSSGAKTRSILNRKKREAPASGHLNQFKAYHIQNHIGDRMASGKPNCHIGPCARCQKAATKICNGCLGAPIYGEHLPIRTFYCDAECQKADWSRHKTECKLLQARKLLSRAAMVLQATICLIRMNAYPQAVASVRVEGTTINLESRELGEKDFQRCLYPFPVNLDIFNNREVLEAALLHLSCTEAMIYLYELAKVI